jgi:hypothetical protein
VKSIYSLIAALLLLSSCVTQQYVSYFNRKSVFEIRPAVYLLEDGRAFLAWKRTADAPVFVPTYRISHNVVLFRAICPEPGAPHADRPLADCLEISSKQAIKLINNRDMVADRSYWPVGWEENDSSFSSILIKKGQPEFMEIK